MLVPVLLVTVRLIVRVPNAAFGPTAAVSRTRFGATLAVTAASRTVTGSVALRCMGLNRFSGGLTSAGLKPLELISEFRLRGPNGSQDEFIELYNNTDQSITVCTADGSGGWALVSSDGVTQSR
jgi:hypothetical protein